MEELRFHRHRSSTQKLLGLFTVMMFLFKTRKNFRFLGGKVSWDARKLFLVPGMSLPGNKDDCLVSRHVVNAAPGHLSGAVAGCGSAQNLHNCLSVSRLRFVNRQFQQNSPT